MNAKRTRSSSVNINGLLIDWGSRFAFQLPVERYLDQHSI
jgi:hypothetical protein